MFFPSQEKHIIKFDVQLRVGDMTILGRLTICVADDLSFLRDHFIMIQMPSAQPCCCYTGQVPFYPWLPVRQVKTQDNRSHVTYF